MWYTIVCVVGILMLKMLLQYRRPSKFPPGPPGLPVIGNIFEMQKLVKETKLFSRALDRLAEKYGPIVGLRLGLAEPLILVSGKEAVVEMLNRPEFDGRPNGFLYRHRTGGVRRGILFTDGKIWNKNRRFIAKTLKKFGFGTISMEKLILQDAISLTNVVTKLSGEGPIKDLRCLTTKAVLSSLWSLTAGRRFDLEKEDPKLNEIFSITEGLIRGRNVSGGIINFFPFLRHILPGIIGFTEYTESLEHQHQFFMDTVLEHKRNGMVGELRDFIDVYLAEMEEEESSNSLSEYQDNQLTFVLKDLFSAGMDTTSNTIGFAIAFLTVNQVMQKKVHDEIDKTIDKKAVPSLADRDRLPYLNAILAEVSRVANVGPTTIPHRATVDTQLLGFEIKKNYNLLANLKSVHMDQSHWGDPEVFRPERFISEQGDFMKDSWLIPFGLGRRRCMGENLAKNSLFLFLACLLQKLHFVLPEGYPTPSLEGIEGFTIAPPDITVLAIPRS